MITVPKACETIIARSRYLSEALAKGIINISALAVYIKPEIDAILQKEVSKPSLIMALNRLTKKIHPAYPYKQLFSSAPDMIVRSNLFLLSLPIKKNVQTLFQPTDPSQFCLYTLGQFETTVVASHTLRKQLLQHFTASPILQDIAHVTAITIRLPKDAQATPGVYYFFLKSFAWERVNILELIPTQSELNIIVAHKDGNKAFAILQSLFTQTAISLPV